MTPPQGSEVRVSASFEKRTLLMSQLGSEPRFVGQIIGPGVPFSAIFHNDPVYLAILLHTLWHLFNTLRWRPKLLRWCSALESRSNHGSDNSSRRSYISECLSSAEACVRVQEFHRKDTNVLPSSLDCQTTSDPSRVRCKHRSFLTDHRLRWRPPTWIWIGSHLPRSSLTTESKTTWPLLCAHHGKLRFPLFQDGHRLPVIIDQIPHTNTGHFWPRRHQYCQCVRSRDRSFYSTDQRDISVQRCHLRTRTAQGRNYYHNSINV